MFIWEFGFLKYYAINVHITVEETLTNRLIELTPIQNDGHNLFWYPGAIIPACTASGDVFLGQSLFSLSLLIRLIVILSITEGRLNTQLVKLSSFYTWTFVYYKFKIFHAA